MRGSGYQVTSRSVLTAAHVVHSAERLRVRFRADQPNEWTVRGTVLWSHDELDIAVVGIDDSGERLAGLEADFSPVRYGAIPELDGTVTCSALGFPLFKLRRPTDGAPPFRDANHVTDGKAPVFSNRREGRLAIRIGQSPRLRDASGERSPWEGMSGAAVWSMGCVIGLVSDHHQDEGAGELSASRVDRWHECLTQEETERLNELIGLPLTRAGLTEVRVKRSSTELEAVRQSRGIYALLEAELRSSPVHHYRLHDRAGPSLDDTYVHQRVEETPDSSGLKVSAPIKAEGALTQHRHVVLEGPPGAGKSTFIHHITRTLAKSWITQEVGEEVLLNRTVLPLRVTAQDLAGPKPLPVLLRESVHKRLGALLSSSMPADIFEEPVHATEWLVLVDGLDEIVDVSVRRRVLDVITADVGRPGSAYRWVVATRPLPTAEAASLRDSDAAVYLLAPFDDTQLRLLASRWLDAESDECESDDKVKGFLQQIDAKGLRQIIRTPLLASIALTVYRAMPAGDLPVGRVGLYEELIKQLLNRRDANGGRRSAWRQTVVEGGGDEALADWLYRNRVRLLTHLAQTTLASDATVTIADAVGWAKSRVPDPPDFFAAWPDAVGALLSDTGLFYGVNALGGLHWAHRSLAEYLVARDAAKSLPDTWPGQEWQTDELLAAALSETRDELAVLTVACWASERGERGAERLAVLLMDRSDRYDDYIVHTSGVQLGRAGGMDGNTPDRYALLAGRLLADGVQLPQDLRTRIMRRIADRTHSHFHFTLFSDVLCALPNTEPAHEALRATLNDTSLSFNSRCEVLPTLSRLSGAAAALTAAHELLAEAPSAVETKIARGGAVWINRSDPRAVIASVLAQVQDPQARRTAAELAEQSCDDIGEAEGTGTSTRVFLADTFIALGDPGRAVRLLRLERPDELTVTRLLAAGGTSAAIAAVRKIAADPDRSTATTISSLKCLVEAGILDPVPEVAGEVLRSVVAKKRQESNTPEDKGDIDEWVNFYRGKEINQLLQLQMKAGETSLSLGVIRAVAGDPTDVDPALVECARKAPAEFADLLRCADQSGFHNAVKHSLSAILGGGDHPTVRLYASLVLYEISDLRDSGPLLRNLFDRDIEAAKRLDVVERLLFTPLRAEADGALVAMATEDGLEEDLTLARLLLWAGHRDEAASVAERAVFASCSRKPDATADDAVDAVRLLAVCDLDRCVKSVARLAGTMLQQFERDPERSCRSLFCLVEILKRGGVQTARVEPLTEAAAELIERLCVNGTVTGFRAAVSVSLALSAASFHNARTRRAMKRACETAPWTQLDFGDVWLRVGVDNAAAEIALSGDYARMQRISRRISAYRSIAGLRHLRTLVQAAVESCVAPPSKESGIPESLRP
ncbi:trypsin-like peptidase domain-containing protein [Streptomyces anthocyanicus]|uniref:trypsin-like peptidase domain-containing protein n=1 Tax=Streptomyces anthocyanicus TaxID=68174 RepID=UPI003254015B